MTFGEILKRIKDIEGWMSEADCFALYDHTQRLKNALIVEIGSYFGRSTKVMALSSPTSKIIAIDPYTDFNKVLKKFKKEIVGLQITLIKEKSQIVGEEWETDIDFLHIDGDHSYQAVKRDIELFVPHVKRGHYVFFHDYPVPDFGIAKAVDELKDKYFDELVMVSGFARGKVK